MALMESARGPAPQVKNVFKRHAFAVRKTLIFESDKDAMSCTLQFICSKYNKRFDVIQFQ